MELEKDNFFNQEKYIKLINDILNNKEGTKKAMVRTYGCQQNVSDSEKIKGMLLCMGYELTDVAEEADFILFNTCAVREHAEDRVFGNVGALKNLKKKNKNLIIALCGCMMEQEHVAQKIKNSFPFVSLLFGTQSLEHFPKLVYKTMTENTRVFERGIENKHIAENIPTHRDNHVKAFVPIMYGCDNFCSYCVVPHVRGRERSRASADIIKEVKLLVRSGYKDITLLGQNVNSYGKNLDEDINFATLLKEIDKIEGDYFLRFMTSHPKDATRELIDVMANGKHICKHLHLPFQSGSDRILKLMNRHYDRSKYMDIVNYTKTQIPGLSLTSDVIVGFPSETYEDFQLTLSLVKEVGFSSLFTFIYSKRVGTKAASMEDPISYEEKSEWFKELLDTQEDMALKYTKSLVGKEMKVLVESKAAKQGALTGRTEENIIVDLVGSEELIGKFVTARITNAANRMVTGEIINTAIYERKI